MLEALRDSAFQQQAVHDDFDRMIFPAVERDGLINIHQVAIHARADVTFLRVLFELFSVLALASPNHRRENHDAIFGLERRHRLHDLLGGLARDGLAALRAVRRTDGAIDHAQVIVDFRDRANGRTRRARGGLLFDGDRGREPLDRIHVGALHLIEELPRIG